MSANETWYGLYNPLKVKIAKKDYMLKSYSTRRNSILLFDISSSNYSKTTLNDFMLSPHSWRIEGAESMLEDFLHHVNNNITIEEKALQIVANVAGGNTTKRQEQEARAASPFHVQILMFSIFVLLKKNVEFMTLLSPLSNPLKEMNEWCDDRLIFLKSNFELRYGGLQPKVINNASLLINHLLPVAEAAVNNRIQNMTILTEAAFYCIDNLQTKLRNSPALTNRGSEFIMSTYDKLEYFCKLLPNLANKEV